MERKHVREDGILPGFDALQLTRSLPISGLAIESDTDDFQETYRRYHRIHKVMVGDTNAKMLLQIHDGLKESAVPDQLDASAWAAAESALVAESESTSERMRRMNSAEETWQVALSVYEAQNFDESNERPEDVQSYRCALNLAYVPLMKSLVAGNITATVRERAFADVLAIAQHAGFQRSLSYGQDNGRAQQFLGFEHECNAHLALLHMDDPRYVPLPSTARGGSGIDYPEQTHDLMVVNQHWGKILKVTPVEIKSKASMHDLKRYKALIVRGKMHLSMAGRYFPEYTRDAFARVYEESDDRSDAQTVYSVTETLKQLLNLYGQGEVASSFDSRTRFRSTAKLQSSFPEFSFDRQGKY